MKGSNMDVIDYVSNYNPRPKESYNPKKIYIDEKISFRLTSLKVRHISVIGQTGTGKTYLICNILSQIKHVIYFDPQVRAYENLKLLGVDDEWTRLRISGGDTRSNRDLKINACDIDSRILQSLGGDKKTSIRRSLTLFFGLPKEERTYSHMKECLLAGKSANSENSDFWKDIKRVLHSKNKGMPLQQLQHGGKFIIDSDEIGIMSFIPALIIESIIGKRVRKEEGFRKTTICIAYDEVQKYANNNTITGKSLGNCAARGRIYGISTLTSGTHLKNAHIDLIGSIKYVFMFNIIGDDIKFYRGKFAIPLYADNIDKLRDPEMAEEKGWNFFFNVEEGGAGQLNRTNTYWKSLKNLSFSRGELMPYHYTTESLNYF